MLPKVWLCPRRTGLLTGARMPVLLPSICPRPSMDVFLLLAGIGELDSASHTISVEATDWSGTDLMLLGKMDSWRVSVDAAEARKAEYA